MGFMDNNIRVNGMEGIKGFNGTFIWGNQKEYGWKESIWFIEFHGSQKESIILNGIYSYDGRSQWYSMESIEF
jgi:hypothetical protein